MFSPYRYPVNGTIRTSDEHIIRLYKNAEQYQAEPCLWEGLFEIACLVKSKPDEETVYGLIYKGIRETETGEFPGSVSEQICIARAALSVFEYNTDKTILKRLGVWLRYLEIEFDQIMLHDNILYRPADLMEFLVRYYNITGMKSVLRICTKLRAAAFDWTTALHTFQQSIPIRKAEWQQGIPEIQCRPDEIDYDTKESLINHAEMLADGIRYTLSSGMFSGHRQDLSSGKTVWEYLSRHHRAICGGTTGNPYLSGSASDQPVSNSAIAAWTEAFASQMVQTDSEWALEELIRIVFNGLEECLNQDELSEYQRVNTVQNKAYKTEKPYLLYARMTRAAAAAYRHAVTITDSGFRINYLLSGKYMYNWGKTRIILHTDKLSAIFRCREAFFASIDLHISRFGTSSVNLINGEQGTISKIDHNNPQTGFYIRTEKNWNNGDGFLLEPDSSVVYEDTHHQGICFFSENKLQTVSVNSSTFAFAACEYPVKNDGKIIIGLAETDKWLFREEEPADIPVLPADLTTVKHTEMIPYSENNCRIAMFPKAGSLCLK